MIEQTHFNCLCCNILKVRSTKTANKYCSNKCQLEFQYKEFINEWLSNQTAPSYKNISNYIRRYIFIKYDNKCCNCGWCAVNHTTGLIPLEIDHIDGNSENNTEDNLRFICPNCHSLTSNYKALNKGNGRYIRRQRYKDGKSY